MNIRVSAVCLMLLLAGCQTLPPLDTPSDRGGRILERDLTVPWKNRYYWYQPSETVAAYAHRACIGKIC